MFLCEGVGAQISELVPEDCAVVDYLFGGAGAGDADAEVAETEVRIHLVGDVVVLFGLGYDDLEDNFPGARLV